jgi:O-methyltransferase involved in polyketide biosynthesis
MNKLKLEPASALAIKWGWRAYNKTLLRNFIDHLDLSSANELYNKCHSICDWYEEAVINKKFFIGQYIKEILSQSENEHLVVILAAGKDPLGLSILIENSDKVDRILEIDLSGMDSKKELYDKLYTEYSDKIKCITADITSEAILQVLNKLLHEFYKEHSCIIVLEGISYFLPEEDLATIIRSLKSEMRNNTIILEYLLPFEKISSRVNHIPSSVFKLIKEDCQLEDITFYTNENIKALFENFGGRRIKFCSLSEIEKIRTGANSFFPTASDGWLECSVWEI